MRRRTFIAALGGAAAWPVVARGQQPSQMRHIGLLLGATEEQDPETQGRIKAFRDGLRGTEVNAAGLSQGLVDQGYLIGRDVAIEDRYADGHAERVPALIARPRRRGH